MDVTHGFATTPAAAAVYATPLGDLLGYSFWVSDVGATTFRINVASPFMIDQSFTWQVTWDDVSPEESDFADKVRNIINADEEDVSDVIVLQYVADAVAYVQSVTGTAINYLLCTALEEAAIKYLSALDCTGYANGNGNARLEGYGGRVIDCEFELLGTAKTDLYIATSNILIEGCNFLNTVSGTYNNIVLDTATNCSIVGNHFGSGARYFINVYAGNGIEIANNVFQSSTSTKIFIDGTPTNLQINHNIGFVTEAWGSNTTAANGGTQAHGLAGTPTFISVTSGNSTVTICGVSAKDATTFTYILKSYLGVAQTGQTVYWYARYDP